MTDLVGEDRAGVDKARSSGRVVPLLYCRDALAFSKVPRVQCTDAARVLLVVRPRLGRDAARLRDGGLHSRPDRPVRRLRILSHAGAFRALGARLALIRLIVGAIHP